MRFFVAILLLVAATVGVAAPVEIQGARVKELPYGTQLVFDTDAPVNQTSFLLDNPPRLVVDISEARLDADLNSLLLRSAEVRAVRTAARGADLRIVVDLAALVHKEAYIVKAGQGDNHLVIDLYRNQRPDPASIRPNLPDRAAVVQLQQRDAAVSVRSNSMDTAQRQPKRTAIKSAQRELVIAIDPGHGGKDTGAIGMRNSLEKDVVFQIAKRLQRLVDKEPTMQAVLTRNDDSYLRLYERIDSARKRKADLFISIHADACEDCSARGSSVFILSTKGASSAAARWLAKKENESDLIGGGLADVDKELVPVVFDMVHDAVLAESMRLADKVLDNLNQVGDVHKGYVERAGFAVLKAYDIPSILVETAFISNPQEEAKLVNPRHQERLAQALMKGIRAYFRQRPAPQFMLAEAPAMSSSRPKLEAVPALPASPLAQVTAVKSIKVAASPALQRRPKPAQVHVIQRGESLADIAERYRISLPSLRSANSLDNNRLRMPVGTPLTIPASDS